MSTDDEELNCKQTMRKVTDHMYEMQFGPSTHIFVCVHGISHPDICEQCESKSEET